MSKRKLVGSVLAFGLAACAAGEPPAAVVPVAAPLAAVELTRPPIGRKVVERWQDGHDEVWTLVAANDESATWRLRNLMSGNSLVALSSIRAVPVDVWLR